MENKEAKARIATARTRCDAMNRMSWLIKNEAVRDVFEAALDEHLQTLTAFEQAIVEPVIATTEPTPTAKPKRSCDLSPGDPIRHVTTGRLGTISDSSDQRYRVFGNEWRVRWADGVDDDWTEGKGFYLAVDLISIVGEP